MIRVSSLVIVLFALFATVAVAEDDLETALRLRNESGADWEAKRYEEAAAKLEQADAIYEKLGGHLADRAVTLRALTWNLVKSGSLEKARATWLRLCHLVAGQPESWEDVWSAYIAVKDGSRTLPEVEDTIRFMEPVRRAAKSQNYPKIAAQVLHDLAFHASARGDKAKAVELLEDAIKERRRMRDLLGLTWSLNNQGYALLDLDRVEEALPRISEAWDLVHRQGQAAPQPNVENMLLAALEKIDELTEVSAKTRKWLWTMGFEIAKSPTPKVIPADRVFRTAMAADPDARQIGKVLDLKLEGLPPEVHADLAIRAARAVPDKAARWLKGVDCGKGPAAPHLSARLLTAQALAAKGRDFPEAAKEAAAAWRELGDREGRESALKDLVEAAKAPGLAVEMPDLTKEYEDLRQSGRPGGAGGSASSSGDRSGYEKLGWHDPLFTISMVDGKIGVEDLVSGKKLTAEVAWVPRCEGLNGLSLEFFGGYVTVKDLAYGGGAAAGGSPGTISLDELGAYRPVPARGAIVILKNGAVRYR